MIRQFEETVLPITEFRHNMAEILESLDAPRVLMKRDKAKAVLVPYELYKKMEQLLEDKMEYEMEAEAADRLNDSEAKYLTHDDFWKKLGVD